jgi:hypothetical protein
MRLLQRSLPVVLLALVLTAGARAQQVEGIEIVDWGIYRTGNIVRYADPRSPSGESYLTESIRLDQATTTIPALVGMTFGLRFKVVGSPERAPVVLKTVVRFPKEGVTNPATGKKFLSAEFEASALVGETTWEAYTLDYEWEVVTGPWTMEIWHGGRKIAEKTFMVTRLVSSAERESRTLRTRWEAPGSRSLATCRDC